MKPYSTLIKRNVKVFFKDKGTFFTALITPMILLVLYATFLYNVYYESFKGALPEGVAVDPNVLKGLVGGLLISSLLAVSTVTVSFCANLIMVQDKVSGARKDLTVAPVKPHTLAVGYYAATVINGLIISLSALLLGLGYLAFLGWYLSWTDVLLLFVDTVLLVLFGTAFASLVCYPLSTQGQVSAVGSIVSSCYGFICGAYMPISQFSKGLQNALSLLPGTHGTSLLRNHALQGACEELLKQGMPAEGIEGIKTVSDCNLSVFGYSVEIWQMYLVVIGAILLTFGIYVLLNVLAAKKRKKGVSKGQVYDESEKSL